ncbi:hypothetical protein [Gilvimarinus chinensis]|uniref:hypothetical protein n=1 Tax=Gilvimarinus chinensis TaxID=396005 RepID=UPI0003768308|nr:hypothetical protein [Gilvimarinus chinensis]
MKRKIQVKDIIRKHVREWINTHRISRETVAMELVEAIKRMGVTELLAEADISFRDTGDTYAIGRTNAQKLFRWLGIAEDGAHEDSARIIELLPVILNAMPGDIRAACGNEILSGTGLAVASVEQGAGDCLDMTLGQMIKECSEAQAAFLLLKSNPEGKGAAVRELSEAVAAMQNAIAVVERLGKQKLKAVE